MASPPGIPPSLSLPRKRGSTSSLTNAAKKRKPSNLRNSFVNESEHVGSPLRYSRSPSVDSVATTSAINGVGGRKRKKKGDNDDTRSVTGSARGGMGGRSAMGSASAVDGEGDEHGDDDDVEGDDEGDDGLEGGLTGFEEQNQAQEKEHNLLLVNMLSRNPSHEHRYSTYTRIKPRKEVLRKIVNQTLSQSVPPAVLIVISGYAKAFIGELIDRALTVRDEWTASRTHNPNPNMQLDLLGFGLNSPHGHRKDARPNYAEARKAGVQVYGPLDPLAGYWEMVPEEDRADLSKRLKDVDKGPLTPAHLREALRRYKRDRDGGGAGFAGMSLEGVERTMGRTGGRKLFR